MKHISHGAKLFGIFADRGKDIENIFKQPLAQIDNVGRKGNANGDRREEPN